MEYAWGSFTSTVSSTQTRLGKGGKGNDIFSCNFHSVAKEITNECTDDTSLLQTTVFVCAVLLSVDLMYSLRGTRRRGDPDASQLLQHLH